MVNEVGGTRRPGLGRLPQHDPRNTLHLMRAALPGRIPRNDTYWPMFHKLLNQGDTGTCVGHGGKHLLLSTPVAQTKPALPPTAFDLYRECCRRDVWPENDNGRLDFGTSVLALAKTLQDLGYIGEYRWAYTAEDVADWLCTRGPVVIGVNWYDSMFEVDERGYLRVPPNNPIAGGHCVMLAGWSEKRGAARIANSWGVWGDKGTGRAWIEGELLDRLLREDGEAMAASEIKKGA